MKLLCINRINKKNAAHCRNLNWRKIKGVDSKNIILPKEHSQAKCKKNYFLFIHPRRLPHYDGGFLLSQIAVSFTFNCSFLFVKGCGRKFLQLCLPFLNGEFNFLLSQEDG